MTGSASAMISEINFDTLIQQVTWPVSSFTSDANIQIDIILTAMSPHTQVLTRRLNLEVKDSCAHICENAFIDVHKHESQYKAHYFLDDPDLTLKYPLFAVAGVPPSQTCPVTYQFINFETNSIVPANLFQVTLTSSEVEITVKKDSDMRH